jgi:hypothetical protein
MKERFATWAEQWVNLLERLGRSGARVRPLDIKPPAEEEELLEAERRIGIALPQAVREILREGSREVNVTWWLPDWTIVRFSSSGDFGWSLDDMEWPDFGGDLDVAGGRYLAFYCAHNGDYVLFDREKDPEDPAVVGWNHETDEFVLLAPSFQEYIERVTALSCIGAECCEYESYCDGQGLDLHGEAALGWTEWIEQYLSTTLADAASNLEKLVLYASMHGLEDEQVKEAFDTYDSAIVLREWQQRLESESESHRKKEWCVLLAGTVGPVATDWVRSLWRDASHSYSLVGEPLHYLTAACLPLAEGLHLICGELERTDEGRKISGFTANGALRFFRNRAALTWMEKHVSFPIGGWDSLFAVSDPEWSDVGQWLAGNDVQRHTAVSGLGLMIRGKASPSGEPDAALLINLLEVVKQQSVLRKEKERVDRVLSHFAADWR